MRVLRSTRTVWNAVTGLVLLAAGAAEASGADPEMGHLQRALEDAREKLRQAVGREEALALAHRQTEIATFDRWRKWFRAREVRLADGEERVSVASLEASIVAAKNAVKTLRADDVMKDQRRGPATREAEQWLRRDRDRLDRLKREHLDPAVAGLMELGEVGIRTFDGLCSAHSEAVADQEKVSAAVQGILREIADLERRIAALTVRPAELERLGTVLNQEETSSAGTFKSTWTLFEGAVFKCTWDNNAEARLTVTSFSDGAIEIERRDLHGPSKGLTATYKGKVEPDGSIAGKFDFKIGRHSNRGNWKAAPGR